MPTTWQASAALSGAGTFSAAGLDVPAIASAVGRRRRTASAQPLATPTAARIRSGTALPMIVCTLTATGTRTRGGIVVTATVPWRLLDPVDGSVLVFSINPNAGGSPPASQPLTNTPTSAPDGTTLVFQGAVTMPVGEFSGVLRDYASYQALVAWTTKPRILVLSDDLGRISWVVFTQFTSVRVPRRNAPERRTYTCRYEVVA